MLYINFLVKSEGREGSDFQFLSYDFRWLEKLQRSFVTKWMDLIIPESSPSLR